MTTRFFPAFSVMANKAIFKRLPGIVLAGLIAALSIFVAERMGGAVMLYALVIGIGLNSVITSELFKSGLSYSADKILKIGVALLGVKITVVDVANLGLQTVGLVIGAVSLTMIIGVSMARLLGLKSPHAVISAGSVAICGSSAALAICSVVPQDKDTESNTVMTVIAVTTLSTLAMVLYPALAHLVGYNDNQAGIFMGVTIHNVAQVVGAGYMVSEGAGDVATIVKLMRVACLVPVIVIVSMMFRKKASTGAEAKQPPLLPFFMVGFITIMLINTFGFIPESAIMALSTLSHWALVLAVAALGVKTSLSDIMQVGLKPIIVLLLQTAFLAVFAMIVISFVMTL